MFYKTHISLRPGAFTDPPARFGDNWKHSDNTWNIPSESFPPDEPPSRWIESIFADVVSRCAFCSVAGWLTRKLNSWPWRSPCTQTTLLWCYFMLESVSQRYIWYIYKVYTYVCTPVQMYSKRSEWTRISCRLAVHPVCKNVSICLRIAVLTLVSNFNKWLCFLRRVEDEWFLIGQLISHSSFTPSDQLVSRFQIHIVFDKQRFHLVLFSADFTFQRRRLQQRAVTVLMDWTSTWTWNLNHSDSNDSSVFSLMFSV